MTSAPRTVLPATTYGTSYPSYGGFSTGGFGGFGTVGATYPATFGTTLPTTTLGATTTALPATTVMGGSISAPVATGGSLVAPAPISAPISAPFVGGMPSLPIGAAALPPVPMLGHTYQSATYSAPTPVMGGSISVPAAPVSPMAVMSPATRTAVALPRSNMFSGYTATPFLAPSQYNLGTSTALSSAVSNVMGATYGASYPGLTTGTYTTGATYPATTYAAPTTTYTTGSATAPA